MDSIVIIAIRAAAVAAIARIVQLLCEVLAPINNIDTIMVILQSGRELFAVFGRPEILFLCYTMAFAMIAIAINNFWTQPRPRLMVLFPLSISQASILGYGCNFLWMAHVSLVLRHSFCDGTGCSVFYASAAVPFIVFNHLWLGIAYLGHMIASRGLVAPLALPRPPRPPVKVPGLPGCYNDQGIGMTANFKQPFPSKLETKQSQGPEKSSVYQSASQSINDKSKLYFGHGLGVRRLHSNDAISSKNNETSKPESVDSNEVEVNIDDVWESVRQKTSKKDRSTDSASDCKSEAQSVAPSVITAIWAPMSPSHPYMLGNRGPARTFNAVIAAMILGQTAKQDHEDGSGYMSETSSMVTVKPFPRQSPLLG